MPNEIPQSWSDPRLYLDKSKHGNGVFSKNKIEAGEVVVAFGGRTFPLDDLKKLPKDMRDYPYQVSDKFVFGPTDRSKLTVADHLNHNCNANCGFISEIFLVAMRDIDEGEELTIDYATCTSNPNYKLECMCDAHNCRRVITGDDWKSVTMQEQYKDFFQPFILDKINKQNG